MMFLFKCLFFSQFIDPKILEPTPLMELKKLKPYFKTLSKREKELETLKKKHEKVTMLD